MSNGENATQQENAGCPGTIIIWGILAFILSIFIGFNAEVKDAGFWIRSIVVITAVIGGTPLGIAGAMIGDVLRRIAKPDAFITDGKMSTHLKLQLFWAIGPQSIGMLIGTFLGCALTAGMLIKYVFS